MRSEPPISARFVPIPRNCEFAARDNLVASRQLLAEVLRRQQNLEKQLRTRSAQKLRRYRNVLNRRTTRLVQEKLLIAIPNQLSALKADFEQRANVECQQFIIETTKRVRKLFLEILSDILESASAPLAVALEETLLKLSTPLEAIQVIVHPQDLPYLSDFIGNRFPGVRLKGDQNLADKVT